MGSTPVFINNLPTAADAKGLWRIFQRWGRVVDVFIPNKLSKIGRRFGFVKFEKWQDAIDAARRLNGERFLGNRIGVKLASFADPKQRKGTVNGRISNGNLRVSTTGCWVEQGHGSGRSYKEVLKEKQGSGVASLGSHSLPRPDPPESAEYLLVHNTKESDIEWLLRSAVGIVRNPKSIEAIQSQLQLGSYLPFRVTIMGGSEVLLTFDSKDEMLAVLEGDEKWVTDLFLSLSPWSLSKGASDRRVWISVEGLPLHAWNVDFLAKLGGCWGDFLGLDVQSELKWRLDVCRFMVLLKSDTIVPNNVVISIDGTSFSLRLRTEIVTAFRDPARKVEPGVTVSSGESTVMKPLSRDIACPGVEDGYHTSVENCNRGSGPIELPAATAEISSGFRILRRNGKSNSLNEPQKGKSKSLSTEAPNRDMCLLDLDHGIGKWVEPKDPDHVSKALDKGSDRAPLGLSELIGEPMGFNKRLSLIETSCVKNGPIHDKIVSVRDSIRVKFGLQQDEFDQRYSLDINSGSQHSNQVNQEGPQVAHDSQDEVVQKTGIIIDKSLATAVEVPSDMGVIEANSKQKGRKKRVTGVRRKGIIKARPNAKAPAREIFSDDIQISDSDIQFRNKMLNTESRKVLEVGKMLGLQVVGEEAEVLKHLNALEDKEMEKKT